MKSLTMLKQLNYVCIASVIVIMVFINHNAKAFDELNSQDEELLLQDMFVEQAFTRWSAIIGTYEVLQATRKERFDSIRGVTPKKDLQASAIWAYSKLQKLKPALEGWVVGVDQHSNGNVDRRAYREEDSTTLTEAGIIVVSFQVYLDALKTIIDSQEVLGNSVDNSSLYELYDDILFNQYGIIP